MSWHHSERLVNLAIALLTTRRYLTKRELQGLYASLGDAWERTFERDKDDLRDLGIRIETGSNDPFFADEVGYRIRRQDFELPPIEFDQAEAEALGAAARVWQQGQAASYTDSALTKLRAAGVEIDSERLAALAPTVSVTEPAFEPVWRAIGHGRRIEFTYRGSDRIRSVDPWSLTCRRGRWYLLGHDHGRGEPRMFKLARITGVPTPVGPSGVVEVPPDVDLKALASTLEPAAPDSVALVAIRADRAPQLRRRGRPAAPPPGITLPDHYAVYEVGYVGSGGLVSQVCEFGADVLVLWPPEVRAQVIAALTVVAQGGSDGVA